MFETHVKDSTRKQITLIANCYALVNFKKLCAPLKALFCEDRGCKWDHIESRFAALVLQWMENLSDRELERFLLDGIVIRSVSVKISCCYTAYY